MLAILGAFLAVSNRGLAGSDIAKRTGLKSGTLYPALFRLERANWLQSEWEEAVPTALGRPRRRTYTLTPEGERQARSVCALVSEMIGGVAWQRA
ncbi:MAG: PadR family transcriptional regulator [Acidobacteriota bacterium]